MKGLTVRQQEVLQFIDEYVKAHGYPPSVREIAFHFNLVSASGVHKHIKALVKKNYLSKQDFASRSMRVLRRTPQEAPAQRSVDLRVPITAVLNEGRLQRLSGGPPESLQLQGSIAAALPARVTGVRVQSAHERLPGLAAGDVLVLDPVRIPEAGQRVLAQISGELHYGVWFAEQGRVAVTATGVPAADDWRDPGHVQVLGVAVGLWKTLT